jgi:hypothetical protein
MRCNGAAYGDWARDSRMTFTEEVSSCRVPQNSCHLLLTWCNDELLSTYRGKFKMHRIGMIDRTATMRALTESEIAIVGGGNWLDVAEAVVKVASAISPTVALCFDAAGVLTRLTA